MRQYQIELENKSAYGLLMHHDNIDWQEELTEWRMRPENSRNSVRGDDRSPAFTWQGYVYHDNEQLVIPSDNIRSCLMKAGALVNKKGQKTYKSDSVSLIMIDTPEIPLLNRGRPIRKKDIDAIDGDFKAHVEAVKKLGFSLLVKRAKVGSAKHVRVRPLFQHWKLVFTVTVLDDETITERVLNDLFRMGGRYVGLGDWRPGAKQSPGPYGQFESSVKCIGEIEM